jgi:hypothetical protein
MIKFLTNFVKLSSQSPYILVQRHADMAPDNGNLWIPLTCTNNKVFFSDDSVATNKAQIAMLSNFLDEI